MRTINPARRHPAQSSVPPSPPTRPSSGSARLPSDGRESRPVPGVPRARNRPPKRGCILLALLQRRLAPYPWCSPRRQANPPVTARPRHGRKHAATATRLACKPASGKNARKVKRAGARPAKDPARRPPRSRAAISEPEFSPSGTADNLVGSSDTAMVADESPGMCVPLLGGASDCAFEAVGRLIAGETVAPHPDVLDNLSRVEGFNAVTYMSCPTYLLLPRPTPALAEQLEKFESQDAACDARAVVFVLREAGLITPTTTVMMRAEAGWRRLSGDGWLGMATDCDCSDIRICIVTKCSPWSPTDSRNRPGVACAWAKSVVHDLTVAPCDMQSVHYHRAVGGAEGEAIFKLVFIVPPTGTVAERQEKAKCLAKRLYVFPYATAEAVRRGDPVWSVDTRILAQADGTDRRCLPLAARIVPSLAP
ncbi:hypothetical protein J8273_6045 [Carpediemonas membranifera]|uniref:Uncharacterized protein n=1 Tax=Carpediemonas membranifera TaxID=201153 RepID=A0A8J6B957_9EUKA|nr:hypothetical protein J8273_6045 [Carpediemonas membranifera]|eukprot:KAG9392577.1 hypothetical protein J8273_6045 [Carpediemonas membranifera]